MCFGNSESDSAVVDVVEAIEVSPAKTVLLTTKANVAGEVKQKRAAVVNTVAYILALAASGFAQGKSPEETYDLSNKVLIDRGIPKQVRGGIILLAAKQGLRLAEIVAEAEDRQPGVFTDAF